ncbi:MAG TPA: glycosyltransferase family 39 protein [Thermoanaerobaculia bacterium]
MADGSPKVQGRAADGIRSDQSLPSRLWAARGFVGGVASIALAFFGQRALLRGSAPSLARWCYGLAILILLATLLRPRFRAGRPPSREAVADPSEVRNDLPDQSGRPLLARLAPVLSALLVAVACALVWTNPSSPQRFAALCWATGISFLLLTSGRKGDRTVRRGLLPEPEDDWLGPGVPRATIRWEVPLATAMLLLATTLRLIGLEDHPGIFGDEGERGLEARAILAGRAAPIFSYGWWGVPNLYFYSIAAVMRLFGDGLFGLRMLSVLSGVAAVFFVYRTARLLWGPRAGLLAGTFLSVSPLALQFSRLAGESTPTGALWAAGFFFLVRSLRFDRSRDAMLSGVSFGLSLYFYPSGKLILALLPAVAAYLFLAVRPRFARRMLSIVGSVFLGLLVTFLPYAVASLKDGWRAFAGRYQERSILSVQNRAEAFASADQFYDPAWQTESLRQSLFRRPLAWGRVLLTQMQRTLEVLYRRGDRTVFYSIRRHAGSMLAPLMAAITLLGLAYSTAKIGDPRFGLSSLWFWGGLLGPALTLDTPSVQRLTGAWPAVMLLPAALLESIIASSWPLSVGFARRWSSVPLLGLVAYVGLNGIQEYFVDYRSLAPYGDATAQARYAAALGRQYKAYQLGVGGRNGPDVYFSYASTRFLAAGVEGVEVTVLPNVLPISDSGRKGAAFLVYPWNAEYLPILHLFYPGGKEELVRSAEGVTRFTSYKIAPELLRSFQTLKATYRQPGGEVLERMEPNLGTSRAPGAAGQSWIPPRGLSYPAVASWEGSLLAKAYGQYTIALFSSATSELWIDGKRALAYSGLNRGSPHCAVVILAKGLHDIRLSGILPNPDARIALTSAFGAEKSAPVESRFLFRGPTGGLYGEVRPALERALPSRPENSEPAVRRIDPVFGFREARDDPTFGQKPFVARWSGSIDTARAGEYRFETRSNGASRLTIDGREVLSTPAGGSSSGAIELRPGSHAIELLYQWNEGRAQLELFWSPPGEAREMVPPTVLSPGRRGWRQNEL